VDWCPAGEPCKLGDLLDGFQLKIRPRRSCLTGLMANNLGEYRQ
jgi:hypothetical protein